MMPFNALAQTMYSWGFALIYVWALALTVACVIVLGFRCLNNAGIMFSERIRLRPADRDL